ncbi:dipeptidase [candidate division CSSED10-310 bacterium]|uniref:Dipeptidase n=1 Tax=candidate division CSSED10-310 bacterium TaxID=2855610 RepID=A0ABV6YRX9_UNCC1
MTASFQADVLRLHEESFVVDLHVDSFLLSRQFGYDFLKPHRAWLPFGALGSHADLPRMKAGGVDAAGFGIVVNPLLGPGKAWRSSMRQIALFHDACERSQDQLTFAAAPDSALKLKQGGVRSGFLGLEGAHCLGDQLTNVESAYHNGVRYITLTHFSSNKAACCAKGLGSDPAKGLTSWGCELIAEMNRLGMIIDLAHVNRAGFLEAIRLSKTPCMVSHGGVASVRPHWRNTDHDMLQALVDSGGIMGIIFAPQFISDHYRDTSEAVLRHIDYMVTHFGEDSVAIGSDFDGYILTTPEDLRDIAMMPGLTAGMMRKGYSIERIQKILGLNFIRVWQACYRTN